MKNPDPEVRDGMGPDENFRKFSGSGPKNPIPSSGWDGTGMTLYGNFRDRDVSSRSRDSERDGIGMSKLGPN